MTKVNFFTAVSFGNLPKSCSQSLLETVDSYFFLGGKKACVISGHNLRGVDGTILAKDSPAFLVTALKVISYLTIILPLLMLIFKTVLRLIHTFYIINAQQKLGKEIEISQDTILKIQELMAKIRGRKDDAEITWHNYANNLVFSLTTVPNLIFRMARPEVDVLRAGIVINSQQLTEESFANMVKAQEVCLIHQLSLLIIPQAKKLNVDGMTLIAQERVNINPNESAQEQLYQLPGLNETAKQLATFIAKTDLSDVAWHHMPVVDSAPEYQGNRHIALINLEQMQGAKTGIFGSLEQRGLIRCLASEEQMDIAINEARRHGIVSQDVAQIKARRLEEIQNDQQLYKFYALKGILENPRKLIQVDDLTSLGINPEEQELMRTGLKFKFEDNGIWIWETISVIMEKAIADVIWAINKGISETPENASLKGKRYICLDHHSQHDENFCLKEYHRLGLPEDGIRSFYTNEELSQTWLKRIIDALVDKGHIFKLDKVNANGYFLQV